MVLAAGQEGYTVSIQRDRERANKCMSIYIFPVKWNILVRKYPYVPAGEEE